MSAERLTANERRLLHEGVCSRHRDNTPGVYVCRPCETAGDAAVEAILAERLADHRRDWADWLDGWAGAVTPTRPTPEAVVEWLRADHLPFGVAAAEDSP